MTALIASMDNLVLRLPRNVIYIGKKSEGQDNTGTSVIPIRISTPDVASSNTISFFKIIESSATIKKIDSIWRKYYQQKDINPINIQTKENAESFYKQISIHTSAEPETSGYPNGEIGFDWETDHGSLSILIDEKNIYFYHQSKNGRRRKGFDSWSGAVPLEVLQHLNSVLNNE